MPWLSPSRSTSEIRGRADKLCPRVAAGFDPNSNIDHRSCAAHSRPSREERITHGNGYLALSSDRPQRSQIHWFS